MKSHATSDISRVFILIVCLWGKDLKIDNLPTDRVNKPSNSNFTHFP